jgi:nucleoside-diphosphate-sugar epimerase
MFKAKIKKERPKVIPEYINKITANRSFDISKAKKELGFEPKVSYEDAAREMIEEYKKLKQQVENVTQEQSKEQG